MLDIHHHWVNSGEYIEREDDRVKRIIDSWRGVRPVIHYSVSRENLIQDVKTTINRNVRPDYEDLQQAGLKRGKLRAHSDTYWNHAVNEWAWTFSKDFDIMCEAKHKQLASIEFYNKMTGNDQSSFICS